MAMQVNFKNDLNFLSFKYGGPEKGRFFVEKGTEFKPWRACRSSWAEERPGCWAGHHLERW